MPSNRFRVALIAILAAVNLAALAFLVFAWLPHWHRKTVARALAMNQAPAFWWPPSWRRELRSSFLLEGGTQVRDPAKRPGNGVVELETEADGRVFRTNVIPGSKGRFTFGDQLFPVGPFRVRLVAPDGRQSRWSRIPEIDPGPHSMNWLFVFEEPHPDGATRKPPS
jgi:hypothetical protein